MTVSDSGFVFWIIFTVTLVGSLVMFILEDAEGAGTPIWEPDEYKIDENPLGAVYNVPMAARGPNNIVYRVWQDDDFAIVVSYTDDNGSTWPWPASQVIASSFEGMTSSAIGGIVVLANNTTCVYFSTVDGEDDYNLYVAFRWEWAGAWDIREIYGGATALAFLKMALNETHLLFMCVSGGNTLRWKTYELATGTFDPLGVPEVWIASWNNAYDYDITVNMSGKFIIASESWSGSQYRYYIRDLDLDHAVIYLNTGATVYEIYCVNLMCRSDDTLVIGYTWFYNGQSSYAIAVWNQTAPWAGFTGVSVNYMGIAGPGLDVYSLGSNIDDDDRIYFYWANDTLTGGDVYISKMRGEGGYTEAQWEAAIVDQVYDYGTHDDEWYAASWYDGRYPIVGGYSVNIPNGGWMGQHIWRDEQGDPDDYAFALYWNASFHWYDWEPGLGGPGPGPSGDGGDDYFDNFTTAMVGNLWVFFVLVALVATVLRETWTLTKKGA